MAAVAPGTAIVNTVMVEYMEGGTKATMTASHTFLVDRLVDVAVTWQNGSAVQAPAGATQQALLFKVINTGNGGDSYRLVATTLPGAGQDFTANNCHLFLDQDNNGSYSNGDTTYVPGSNDPALAAGAAIGVLAMCDIPETANDGRFAAVQLAATSMTLSGAPGTAAPDPKIPGVTAVVGLTGGTSAITGTYQASNADYLFTSTFIVTDKSGGSVATNGSRITYSLVVTPNGGKATGRNLVVTDAMPDFTTYVPGSLTLDAVPLSDASDSDAGDFNITKPASISVKLGNVPGTPSNPHTISFQVTIN